MPTKTGSNEPATRRCKVLKEMCSSLYLDETLKDCELHASDGILKFQKLVLAARSPVFKEMLTEETRTVKMPDFNSRTMHQLLRSAYFLEVEDLDEVAHDLFYAAEKYQMWDLVDKCVESLILNLTRDNVLQSMNIAAKIKNSDNFYHECYYFSGR